VTELWEQILHFVPTDFDLLIVRALVCSCLEFGLTLGLIPRVYVASSCSLYFSKLNYV
jgi:hypothetical protein